MKMMKKRYSVAGYVKLAKLWEKNKKQALEYHREYYSEKYLKIENYMLYDVYVDITGQKQIYKKTGDAKAFERLCRRQGQLYRKPDKSIPGCKWAGVLLFPKAGVGTEPGDGSDYGG